MAQLAEAVAGRELVIVPGNHDHHLIEPWLERRGLDRGSAARARAASAAAGTGLRGARGARRGGGRELRLPGPVAARRRLRNARPLPRPPPDRADDRAARRRPGRARARGRRRPAPTRSRRPTRRRGATIEEYERVQTPVYALLYGLAQATVGDRRGGRQPVGAAVADDGRRREPRGPGARLAARLGRAARRGRGRQPTRPRSGARRPLLGRDRPGRASRRWPTWSPTSGSRPSTSSSATPIAAGGPEPEARHVAVERRQLGALARRCSATPPP